MKKSLFLLTITILIVLLMYGCIASYGKINVVLSITPTDVYEGEAVTITLNTIPSIKLSQFFGGEIILDNKTIKSFNEVPYTIFQILPAGTHTVYGKIQTYSGEYESTTVTLYVKPASEKYKVLLEMNSTTVKSGQIVDITINLNETPDSSWSIELYINDNLVKTFFSVPATYKWNANDPGEYKIYARLNLMENEIKSNEYDVKVADSTKSEFEYVTTIPRSQIGENQPVYAFVKFNDDVPVISITSILEDASNAESAISEASPIGKYGFVKVTNGLKEGTYKASIWLQNSDGLLAGTSITFTVKKIDTKPPAISIDINNDNHIFSPDEDIIVDVNATDDTKLQTYQLYLDDQLIDEKYDINYPTLSVEKILRNINQGYHYLRTIVWDKTGKYTVATRKILVTDLLVDLQLDLNKETILPGDSVNIYIITGAASDLNSIDKLTLTINDDTLYSYYSTDTTASSPSFVHKWIASVGTFYITSYIRLKDGREGLATKIVNVPDLVPPSIENLSIDGIQLATDTSKVIPQGLHNIVLSISDNWKLPEIKIIELEVWKNLAEPDYVTTIPLELDAFSSDSKQATYTAPTDLSTGDYIFIPKDIKDYAGNKISPDEEFLISVR